jgi:hypothetical protein
MLSEANWRNPLKWNRAAKDAGLPAKVFCASMADVFEVHPVAEVNAQLDGARLRLWSLIEQTPCGFERVMRRHLPAIGDGTAGEGGVAVSEF